jgi:threonine dehydrogenase-like Zn-dependent dehydrogenase
MASAITMQALNYLGPYQVRVEEVEKPKLEHPDDIIVKVTTVSSFFAILLLLAEW